MNKYRVLQIAIPDLAIVYGGVRGRTLSSSHLAHARNALALAGISQVIDLRQERQDYTSDRYRDICEANGPSNTTSWLMNMPVSVKKARHS